MYFENGSQYRLLVDPTFEKDQKMLVSLSSCRGVASGIMYGTMWTDKKDIDAYLKDLEEWWEITKKTKPKSSGRVPDILP